jgi:hypothetical protein
MPFKRYVEIGRVALVNFGEDYGKLVVITDVVDQNRVSAVACARRSHPFFGRKLGGCCLQLQGKELLYFIHTRSIYFVGFSGGLWCSRGAAAALAAAGTSRHQGLAWSSVR